MATYTGRLITASGNPILGALVKAYEQSSGKCLATDVTDIDGRYSLTDLEDLENPLVNDAATINIKFWGSNTWEFVPSEGISKPIYDFTVTIPIDIETEFGDSVTLQISETGLDNDVLFHNPSFALATMSNMDVLKGNVRELQLYYREVNLDDAVESTNWDEYEEWEFLGLVPVSYNKTTDEDDGYYNTAVFSEIPVIQWSNLYYDFKLVGSNSQSKIASFDDPLDEYTLPATVTTMTSGYAETNFSADEHVAVLEFNISGMQSQDILLQEITCDAPYFDIYEAVTDGGNPEDSLLWEVGNYLYSRPFVNISQDEAHVGISGLILRGSDHLLPSGYNETQDYSVFVKYNESVNAIYDVGPDCMGQPFNGIDDFNEQAMVPNAQILIKNVWKNDPESSDVLDGTTVRLRWYNTYQFSDEDEEFWPMINGTTSTLRPHWFNKIDHYKIWMYIADNLDTSPTIHDYGSIINTNFDSDNFNGVDSYIPAPGALNSGEDEGDSGTGQDSTGQWYLVEEMPAPRKKPTNMGDEDSYIYATVNIPAGEKIAFYITFCSDTAGTYSDEFSSAGIPHGDDSSQAGDRPMGGTPPQDQGGDVPIGGGG
jgi:hypothetical protein